MVEVRAMLRVNAGVCLKQPSQTATPDQGRSVYSDVKLSNRYPKDVNSVSLSNVAKISIEFLQCWHSGRIYRVQNESLFHVVLDVRLPLWCLHVLKKMLRRGPLGCISVDKTRCGAIQGVRPVPFTCAGGLLIFSDLVLHLNLNILNPPLHTGRIGARQSLKKRQDMSFVSWKHLSEKFTSGHDRPTPDSFHINCTWKKKSIFVSGQRSVPHGYQHWL